MNNFIILTEATCDLPESYLKEHDIECLPMLYTIDGKEYYLRGDGEQLSMKEFYAKMRSGLATKTSQINPTIALDMLRPYAESGKDILYLGFSSALSGTVGNVVSAMKTLETEFPKGTFIGVDSLCASMGEGLFVDYAVKMRDSGKTIKEIADFLETNKQSFCQYFTVDDLHHLHRGGRVSKFTAIVGTLLGIKPILYVSPDGKLTSVDKVKGRKKALANLVSKMREKIIGFKQTVFISHGDCEEDAQFVADLITKEFGITDIMINYIGPVVGSHSGPGTVALFFFGKDRLK